MTATNRQRTNGPGTNGFVTVILSQSEGLDITALGIMKYFYDRPSQPISVIWFAVSCCGPKNYTVYITIILKT